MISVPDNVSATIYHTKPRKARQEWEYTGTTMIDDVCHWHVLLGYSLHEKIMPCSIQLAVETFIRAKTLRPLSITTGATTYATGVFLLRRVKKS